MITRTTPVSLTRAGAVWCATTAVGLALWAITGRGLFWPLWLVVYFGWPVVAEVGRRVRRPA